MNKKIIPSESYEYLSKCIMHDNEKDFVKALAEVKDINERDSFGETLLWRAVNSGRLSMAQQLIQKGANVEIPDKEGFLPLYASVQNGDIFMTQLLFEAGVNIHAIDPYGNNALGWVLFCQQVTAHHLLFFLLKHGVDPDRNNYYGNSARGTAEIIANYDYRSVIINAPSTPKLSDRIRLCKGVFDDMVITSLDVLNGAPITVIRYYSLDKIWEFQTASSIDPQRIRVTSLHSLIERNKYLTSVMRRMLDDQIALYDSTGWTVHDIERTSNDF